MQIKKFKRIAQALRKGSCILILLCILFSDAYAKVCFLPGGRCVGEARNSNSGSGGGIGGFGDGGIPGIQAEQCLGYTLTQIKCKDQACEEGWNCESCTNAQGTYYKCTEKPTPDGYTKNKYECDTPCQAYEHSGFTGNQVNGKCTPIAGYSTTKPAECTSFQTPDYVYGVEVYGNKIEDLHSKDKERYKCYYNVVPLAGGDFKREKPESCTTYDIKTDSYNKDCYANAVSIGEHFTTDKRNETAFIVEMKKGTDGVACYRAKSCNTANGWLDASEVDGSIFEYSELSSDGVTCRKATACKESNQWFNKDKLGKYTNKDSSTTDNKYFDAAAETRSSLTCYKATGCHSKAYASQPDSRYFKSSKFDETKSNGHKCWIVTGKADYAYYADDRKQTYFDYMSETAHLNGGNTDVTYYIVNKDNSRNGCMQYAYENEPDGKYFAKTSQAQYSNGSSTKKTCWNITGKGTYAYAENEKVTTHFVYDEGSEGYLNGTSSKVKYFDMTGRNSKAYDAVTETTHFAYDDGVTQYKDGVSSTLIAYVATGCAAKAYDSNNDTTHFAYDGGKKRYFNGAGDERTCYNVTGCASKAYDNNNDTTHFAYDAGKKAYFSGAGEQQTCYNVTGCASGYTSGYSSVNSCGIGKSVGWSFDGGSATDCSGDILYCGKCSAINGCDSGYSKDVSSCGTGYSLAQSGYYGNTLCGKCNQRPCSDGGYVSSCTAVACSSSNRSSYTTCTSVTYGGLTCYNSNTYNCSCTTRSAGTSVSYGNKSVCTAGYNDPDTCGNDNTCVNCADGSSWTSFDGVNCKSCSTSTYPLSNCPANGTCSSCRDGSSAGTYHYRLDSCSGDYKISGNSCVLKSCSDYNTSYLTSCSNAACSSSNSTKVTCTSYTPRTGLTCYTKATEQCSCSAGGYNNASQNFGCNTSGYKRTNSSAVTHGSTTCYTTGSNTACSCSEGWYVDSCTSGCNGNSTVSCTSKTYGGGTCYIKTVTACGSGQTCCSGTCKNNAESGTKPAASESQSCGCGGTQTRTRTVTWNICSQSYTTGTWSGWSTCSNTCSGSQTCCSGTCKNNAESGTKPAASESQSCGCGGTQARTRTVTWNICSQSYTTGTWSGWSNCSKSACSSGYTCYSGSCYVNSKTETQNCTQTTTDSSGCTATSQSCGTCKGTQTRTGSRTGSRSGTQSRTCTFSNGSYSCGNWGSCSGSGNYTYGTCSYSGWSACSKPVIAKGTVGLGGDCCESEDCSGTSDCYMDTAYYLSTGSHKCLYNIPRICDNGKCVEKCECNAIRSSNGECMHNFNVNSPCY